MINHGGKQYEGTSRISSSRVLILLSLVGWRFNVCPVYIDTMEKDGLMTKQSKKDLNYPLHNARAFTGGTSVGVLFHYCSIISRAFAGV